MLELLDLQKFMYYNYGTDFYVKLIMEAKKWKIRKRTEKNVSRAAGSVGIIRKGTIVLTGRSMAFV